MYNIPNNTHAWTPSTFLIFFHIQYYMLADIQGENESKILKHLER